jgi:hypothetical protein
MSIEFGLKVPNHAVVTALLHRARYRRRRAPDCADLHVMVAGGTGRPSIA